MRSATKRLGLSFEIAPPRAAHPNRTDIACFIGTVARRVAPQPRRVMPPVLARWLASLGFVRIGGIEPDALTVDLDSREHFVASLLAQASAAERDALTHALGFDALDTATAAFRVQQLAQLIAACQALSPVPASLVDDLAARGYAPRRLLGPDELAGCLRLQRLHNLPIAVESFEEFDQLFAWEARPVLDRTAESGDPVVTTALGAAVRAFFGEGGRRCWIVRTGDPVALFAAARKRFAASFPQPKMPAGDADAPTAVDLDPERCLQITGVARVVRMDLLADVLVDQAPLTPEPSEWQGLEHVYGLPEVSFACLPDLVDACARDIPALVPPAAVVAAPETFHDCVIEAPPDTPPAGRRLPAPMVNALGLEVWRQLVARAVALLANGGRAFHRRDVELLVSLPLTGDGRDLPGDGRWLEWMASRAAWLTRDEDAPGTLMSDRLQLVYPWLVTRDSGDCQGGVEAPEGTLAGILARGAVQRGAFRSLAGQPATRYIGSQPALDWTRATQQDVSTPLGLLTRVERVCLIGPSARGVQMLSDVTCSVDAATRQGAVRRLVNVVLQVARIAGDEFAFDANGEALWSRVRERLEDLGRVLLAAGALSTDGVSFTVRCGRDTMTQADVDAGRLIAEVELLAAQPIQRIVVVLALRDAQPAAMLRAA